jgi:hypothetical protein
MSIIVERNRFKKQVGVLDAYGDYNPGGIIDTPLDDLIYLGSQSQDPTIVQSDPAFTWGGTFEMTATNSGNTGNANTSYITTLHWTFPNFSTTARLVTEPPPLVLLQLILQRSSITRATPLSDVGDGGPSDMADVAYSLLPAHGAWTTLLDLRPNFIAGTSVSSGPLPANYPFPTSFQDNVGANTFYNYRLIAIFSFPNNPPTFLEVDWNVVTVVTPFDFSANTSPSGILLSWKSPTLVVPYITNFTHAPCVPASCGCYRLDYQPPITSPPALLRYLVWKSYDGITFFNHVGANIDPAPPGAASWYDSDCARNIWYYFQAQYSDGTLLDSSIIHASY